VTPGSVPASNADDVASYSWRNLTRDAGRGEVIRARDGIEPSFHYATAGGEVHRTHDGRTDKKERRQ